MDVEAISKAIRAVAPDCFIIVDDSTRRPWADGYRGLILMAMLSRLIKCSRVMVMVWPGFLIA